MKNIFFIITLFLISYCTITHNAETHNADNNDDRVICTVSAEIKLTTKIVGNMIGFLRECESLSDEELKKEDPSILIDLKEAFTLMINERESFDLKNDNDFKRFCGLLDKTTEILKRRSRITENLEDAKS